MGAEIWDIVWAAFLELGGEEGPRAWQPSARDRTALIDGFAAQMLGDALAQSEDFSRAVERLHAADAKAIELERPLSERLPAAQKMARELARPYGRARPAATDLIARLLLLAAGAPTRSEARQRLLNAGL